MIGQDLDQNFMCLICTDLANDAVETQCCGQIMCEVCSADLIARGLLTCPNCRQSLVVSKSAMARRLISTIKIPCPSCNENIAHKQMKAHKKKCPKRSIECKDCSAKITIQNIVSHMKEQHYQKLLEICLEYHIGLEENPSLSKISSSSSGSMVVSTLKTSKGKKCHLGTTGKYYCGQRNLIGRCGCCDGQCGPTNGENCDDCMQEDVKRYNLGKGYFVNTAGAVCQLYKDTKICFCGRLMGDRTYCRVDSSCRDCGRVTNSIAIGRYKNLY